MKNKIERLLFFARSVRPIFNLKSGELSLSIVARTKRYVFYGSMLHKQTIYEISRNQYEMDTINFLKNKSYQHMIDLGANVGYYAIFLEKCFDKVFCFEPDVVNLKYLFKNISVNLLGEKIVVCPGPVSSLINEEISFVTNNKNPALSAVDVQNRSGVKLLSATHALHELIRETRSRSFLKIDIEGSDLSVIEGIFSRGDLSEGLKNFDIMFEYNSDLTSVDSVINTAGGFWKMFDRIVLFDIVLDTHILVSPNEEDFTEKLKSIKYGNIFLGRA